MAVTYLGDNAPDGTTLGLTASEKISFYAATPVVQPSGAGQDALTASSSDAAAIGELITLVTQLRADLVTLGLIKGSS